MSHSGSALTFAVAPEPCAVHTRFSKQGRKPASFIGKASIRNPALRLGVVLGTCFSVVGLSWLVLANRVPYFDQFALQRNLALAIAFAALGLVPTGRFLKSPGKSLVCGIMAWTIFTATYFATELYFQRLATRLSAFHLLVLGSLVLGFLAAFTWVMNLTMALRRAR
jgi:hypothetical protein